MVVPQQSALWALAFWLLVAQNVTVIWGALTLSKEFKS